MVTPSEIRMCTCHDGMWRSDAAAVTDTEEASVGEGGSVGRYGGSTQEEDGSRER